MNKRFFFIVSALFFLLLSGCGGQSEEDTSIKYNIYYVNRSNTGISKVEVASSVEENSNLEADESASDNDEISSKIKTILSLLAEVPNSAEYKKTITEELGDIQFIYSDGQVTLYFGEEYNDMPSGLEVLTRGAIVRTLTQLEDIRYVTFIINEEPLTDLDGNLVGLMTADTFLDNEGSEINNYEKTTLKLYFSNSDGTKLVEANRTIVYNSNISLEKLVVEQLIQGPANTEIYPCINPDTQIINITVKDMICYVNLSKEYLEPVNGVNPNLTLFSLVNSLVELSSVNKVQILIDGETDIMFRELTSLNTIFQRDLTIVQ